MPTRCRTCEKQVPMQYTDGAVRYLPWCIEHSRWFAECQCRQLADFLGEPVPELLPAGVVDFMRERAKRQKEHTDAYSNKTDR